MRDKIFEFIKKVNSIAHIGTVYSKDEYALDNYQELLDLSTKMLKEYINLECQPYNIYQDMFYPTPQPCVRNIIIDNHKILLVQEANIKDNGKWSLPGGWCDIGDSPLQAAKKEAKEETGYEIEITKLLAIQNADFYKNSQLYSVYNIYFLSTIVGGENNPNFEIKKVSWFDLNDLPPLSNKTSLEELNLVLKNHRKGDLAYFE